MASNTENSRPSSIERHLQTFILTLLIGSVSWAGTELVKLGRSSAVLQERLTMQGALLNEMRAELKEWGNVYYRQADARRELDAIESRIDNLNDRVNQLEGRR